MGLHNFLLKSACKGTIRAMSISFFAARNAHPEMDVQNWISMALQTRPGWLVVDGNRFIYRNGGGLQITATSRLVDIIKQVMFVEHQLLNEQFDIEDRVHNFAVVIDEIEKVYPDAFTTQEAATA